MEKYIEHIEHIEKKQKIVTTRDIGAKVKKGRDWAWGNQIMDSQYGIIEDSDEVKDEKDWVWVQWYDSEGNKAYCNSYRIGCEDAYDLYYY